MTGEADLRNLSVLVVEDDYYLASDTARALQAAGAHVLGPCASEDAAWDELKRGAPHAAVVDINLGEGSSFKLARELRRRGVAFVFITGYDAKAIPLEFRDIKLLQKPFDLRQILSSLLAVLGLQT